MSDDAERARLVAELAATSQMSPDLAARLLDNAEGRVAIPPAFMAWLIDCSWDCESPMGEFEGLPCGWSSANYRLACKGCGAPHPQADTMRVLAAAAGYSVDEYDRIIPPPA